MSWRTDSNYVGEVRYDTKPQGGRSDAYTGVAKGLGGLTTPKFDGYIHHVELTGLEPYTVYYFVCGNPDFGWSEELSFRTAPMKSTTVRFALGGDARKNALIEAETPIGLKIGTPCSS